MKELAAAIERATGVPPVRYAPRTGGYSTADRFAVELADGRSVFVKSSAVPTLAAWLRREHEVYAHLSGAFLPGLEGFDSSDGRVTLVLEDLSGADWSVRWDRARVDAVLDAVSAIAASEPPPNTPRGREVHSEFWARWDEVAADPGPFLSLGLRDAGWLGRRLPQIRAALAHGPGDGEDLCHMDLRSDNLCFRAGRAILVDWNWLCLADSRLDLAAWAPSLALEGGPPPWEVVPDAGDLAALVSGVWAAVAGLPPPETAPTVRDVQRRQLAVALDWLDRELD
jgi:Phosphotransferase enzyme family